MNPLVLILAIFLTSCTHFLTDTKIRIQVENNTGREIHSFSLLSQTGQIKVLVPDTLNTDKLRSEIYGHELVGEFNFAVFSGDSLINLGVHRLKGVIALAQIRENEGVFVLRFK